MFSSLLLSSGLAKFLQLSVLHYYSLFLHKVLSEGGSVLLYISPIDLCRCEGYQVFKQFSPGRGMEIRPF